MRMVIEEIEKDSVNRLLKLVAPGTAFRDGLESVLRAKTGALIIVGFSPEVMDIVDGGFSINSEFSPSYLYELAKMDGAIIVSEDFKRILYANTQLIPNPNIPSIETGTRHRTAERVAKQTGKLVVSISQRRNIITIYHEELRYALKDISVILNKANQAVSTLDKYKSVFDQSITNLGALEFEELVSLQDVVSVIQRGEMVKRIRSEVERYVNELGTEGRLVSMQLEELVFNIDAESKLLIQDYTVEEQDEVKIHEILHALRKLNSEELLDQNHIVRLLGHPYNNSVMDAHVSPRGYRVLNKIPRLPGSIVDNLIEEFGQFSHLMMATIDELDEVDGIGEVRARTIKDGLKRIQDQVLIDRHI